MNSSNTGRTFTRKAAFAAAIALALFSALSLAPQTAKAAEGALTTQSVPALGASVAPTSTQIETQTATAKLGLKSGHTFLIRSAVGADRALNVKSASTANNANVNSAAESQGYGQQWVVDVNPKGYATLKSVKSGRYLTVNGSAKKSGANVTQRTRNGSLAQKWKVTKNANGTYRLTSALNRKLSLDVDGASTTSGANVQVWAKNKTKAQQWRFYDITKMRSRIDKLAKKNKGSVKAGTYVIFSKTGSMRVLDIYNGSTKSGANLWQYSYNGSPAQMFTISYDKQGYAHIMNASGKYLGVAKSRATSGANVKQFQKANSLAQKWIIVKKSNGTFRIQSALWEKLSLDVDGGLSAVGTNVQVYANNSTAAQRWAFKTPAAAAKAFAKAEAAAAKAGKITLRGSVKQSYQGLSLRNAKAAGIDVSVWNGNIDWYKVAASGIRFAIIRCGYGDDYASQDDVKFLQNVKGARAAGLDIGVYLYSYATNTAGAQREAAHTLRMLKAAGLTPDKVKYGVYYDVEEAAQYNANMAPVCDKYCSIMKSAGYKAGVYSSLSWWNSRLYSTTFNKWNRWVAQWPPKTGSQVCAYSGSYKIWQCMSDGSVPGIVGRVDMNLAY